VVEPKFFPSNVSFGDATNLPKTGRPTINRFKTMLKPSVVSPTQDVVPFVAETTVRPSITTTDHPLTATTEHPSMATTDHPLTTREHQSMATVHPSMATTAVKESPKPPIRQLKAAVISVAPKPSTASSSVGGGGHASPLIPSPKALISRGTALEPKVFPSNVSLVKEENSPTIARPTINRFKTILSPNTVGLGTPVKTLGPVVVDLNKKQTTPISSFGQIGKVVIKNISKKRASSSSSSESDDSSSSSSDEHHVRGKPKLRKGRSRGFESSSDSSSSSSGELSAESKSNSSDSV